uniref:uncharacterized protein LOC120956245 n=1 Tax=Anopheles coluzzii TaxID=1518534 RepID=UPI0020FF9F22|nr:uncharacterized protein LOC120956245 [Anopheles coluzzii]
MMMDSDTGVNVVRSVDLCSGQYRYQLERRAGYLPLTWSRPRQVSTIYYVPNLVGKHEQAFYNRTINFCTYLRKPFTDRVLKIIYEHLDQRGNLPKRCPIAPGTYTFKTCFDGIQVPSFFPESSFRIDVYFRRPNSAPFFQSSWFGEMRKES